MAFNKLPAFDFSNTFRIQATRALRDGGGRRRAAKRSIVHVTVEASPVGRYDCKVSWQRNDMRRFGAQAVRMFRFGDRLGYCYPFQDGPFQDGWRVYSQNLGYSRTAGCGCGCSPGFLVDGDMRGMTYFVHAYHMPGIANMLAEAMQALCKPPEPTKSVQEEFVEWMYGEGAAA